MLRSIIRAFAPALLPTTPQFLNIHRHYTLGYDIALQWRHQQRLAIRLKLNFWAEVSTNRYNSIHRIRNVVYCHRDTSIRFLLARGAICKKDRICAETSVSNALRTVGVSLAYQIGFSLARVAAAAEQQAAARPPSEPHAPRSDSCY